MRTLPSLTLALLILAVGGCACQCPPAQSRAAPPVGADAAPASASAPAAPPRRSLVTLPDATPRTLPQARAQAPQPWYAWRNDVLPSTRAGVQSPTRERTVTYTRDRMLRSGTHVSDIFDASTYRTEVKEITY